MNNILSEDAPARCSIAADPSTPAELLTILARDQDAQVRQAVAANPNTPWPILGQLAWQFPREFLHNPVGPLQIMAHPQQMSTDVAFLEVLLQVAPIPPVWWRWLRNQPALKYSERLRLHVQNSEKTGHPYQALQKGEERDMFTLMELLTAALAQGSSPLSLPINTRTGQEVITSEQLVEKYLQRLARDKRKAARLAVAENPHTPAQVLASLALDPDGDVRKMVAANPHTSSEVLASLAPKKVRKRYSGPDYWGCAWQEEVICRAVARNPQAPEETLRSLALDRDIAEDLRIAAVEHPSIPLDVLCSLAQDGREKVRQAAINHPQMPEEMLRTLALDQRSDVRYHVAGNPKTPEEVLRVLARDQERDVLTALAWNPHTPVEVLRSLARNKELGLGMRVAGNPHTPAEVLASLAQDGESTVREKVAGNPNTPADVLRSLAHDQEVRVRRSLADNPNIPADVLRSLARDRKQWVRSQVAAQSRTPAEILHALARGRAIEVRKEVAWNWQTPADARQALTQDPRTAVRCLAKFVQSLLAEIEEPSQKEQWWTQLRPLCWSKFGIEGLISSSPEEQVKLVNALNVPACARQAILAVLAADWGAGSIRHAFAPPTKGTFLQRLCGRRDLYSLLMSPWMPAIALQKLASSPLWEVRYLVALHKQTPQQTRQRLSQDSNRYVQAVARAQGPS